MEIVSGKANQVDEQEYHREMEVRITVSLEIEPQSESYRNRDPAEIKYTCKDVRNPAIMDREIFARN